MGAMASPSRPTDDSNTWKRCSTCRGAIPFGSTYYVCSVSTCNRARVTYRFCSVECWEEHLPLMRHREAWAVEEQAPSKNAWEASEQGSTTPKPPRRPTTEVAPVTDAAPSSRADGTVRRRIRVGSAPRPAAPEPGDGEVLVVVSRLKNHMRERFGVNTSDAVMGVLSDHIRGVCRRAVDNARADGRKTVMDRDFEFLRRR